MDPQIYGVLDASGTVVNAIVWDGVAAYAQPAGCTLEALPEGIGIGFTKQPDGTWRAPAIATAEEPS